MRKISQNAFTLAEVLITLGIIGVVAALTLPSLISNSQKQETVTRYQKIYSTLTNMIKLSEVDNGPVDNWDFGWTAYDAASGGTNETFLKTYILPYLNIAKSCGGTVSTGCWTKKVIQMPNGNDLQAVGNIELEGGYLKYMLNDGTAIAFCFVNGIDIQILIDIDGKAGLHRMGKDIFVFYLAPNFSLGSIVSGYKVPSVGGVYPVGNNIDINISNYSKLGCGTDVTNVTGAGSYCGEKIIQDGYKIKDDYPW